MPPAKKNQEIEQMLEPTPAQKFQKIHNDKNYAKIKLKKRQSTMDQIGQFIKDPGFLPGKGIVEEEKEEDSISSDNSEENEFAEEFKILSESEKKERLLLLWKIFFSKLKGANIIL